MVEIGIYEKALAPAAWPQLFSSVRAAGYDFLELSIDETPARLGRLNWSSTERARLRLQAAQAHVRIASLSLSAHRTWSLGSSSVENRRLAQKLLRDAIELAHDLGAGQVQLAGYFAYHEPAWADARAHFLSGVADALPIAEHAGVRLAIENMDGTDIRASTDLLDVLTELGSEGLRAYADVGNFAANGLDVCTELEPLLPCVDSVQLKDAKPGVFRRVAFGEGVVPFAKLFSLLEAHAFTGNLSVEMWNDDGDPTLARSALDWLLANGLGRLAGIITSEEHLQETP